MHLHKNHIDEFYLNSIVNNLKSQNINMYYLIVLHGQTYNVDADQIPRCNTNNTFNK